MRSTCEPQGLPLQWRMQCSGLISQWWVFTGEMHVHSSQHYLGDRQHILTPLFSSGAGELLPLVLVNLKSWITWAGCWRNRGHVCQWHGTWAAENCTPCSQLYVMDTSWSSPGVKPTMSHKCMSQSSSHHDLVVLDLKPVDFPEAVHRSSSAASELLLSCDSGHTVLSSGQGSCWCIILGCFVFLWLSEPTVGYCSWKKWNF